MVTWHQPGPGVPKQLSQTHNRSLRIEDEQWERVRRVAVKNHTTIAELLRTYIEWGLEEDKK